jgi:hypothetical protein
VSDIGTGSRQKLDAVTGAHHLAATRRDAVIYQKPIEGDAFIAQRVALVDADDRRRQALDILACGEAGPRERTSFGNSQPIPLSNTIGKDARAVRRRGKS